jgi:hypothetical protein
MARTIRISGIDDVLQNLGVQGARELQYDLDQVVERSARTMANDAAHNAPYKTGKLASSIPPSVEKLDEMHWQFGSDVEYATRQEYEHATKKGFFRKSVWSNREDFRLAIIEAVNRHGA